MRSKLLPMLFVIFIQSLLGASVFAIDKKDFINRAGLMMMAPCEVKAYLDCIQVKQAACKQAVKQAGRRCSDRVPNRIDESQSQAVMQTFGRCMSNKIVDELKLDKEKIANCRTFLQGK